MFLGQHGTQTGYNLGIVDRVMNIITGSGRCRRVPDLQIKYYGLRHESLSRIDTDQCFDTEGFDKDDVHGTKSFFEVGHATMPLRPNCS